ncbi:AMP-binding protein, partial [Streptomyces sp. NPDC031705]|uniref:AMP-binding protein n=1 Tax=Streptomyces sp. NPDC031705 TaxID=3155729 RepID=UPI0033D5E9D1
MAATPERADLTLTADGARPAEAAPAPGRVVSHGILPEGALPDRILSERAVSGGVPPGEADRAADGGGEPSGGAGAYALFSAGPAAPPRTLLDVFEASVRAHPDEPALDDGTSRLTYRALAAQVERRRRALAAAGVGLGDRVGVRIPSGTNELYVAVLAVLAAGAAYVPVDAEDPDERARLVFREAGVRAVMGAGRRIDPVD